MCVLQWFSPADGSSIMEITSCSRCAASSSNAPARQDFSETAVQPSYLLPPLILPLSLLSHTLTCIKCHKWLLPREREAGKSTTQTLMKNKSPLNPIWKEFQPSIHHSFLSANPLLVFHHPISFLPYLCMLFPSYALSNPAVMPKYEQGVTSMTTDLWKFKTQSRLKAVKQGF